MFPKRRHRLGIMVEILEIAKESTKKTNIMYKAKISYKQLEDYIPLLLDLGLLNKEDENYKTTPKGMFFIESYKELTKNLN